MTLPRLTNRIGLPLAIQMIAILVCALIGAQFVTLGLTVILPPSPTARWNIDDVAHALRGSDADGEVLDRLERKTMIGPPDVSGQGWLVSESSREALANRLNRRSEDVVLAFYTQLPVGGVAVPAKSRSPLAIRDNPASPSALSTMLVGKADAQSIPGGPPAGGMPGPAGMPGGHFPGGQFPGGRPGGQMPGAQLPGGRLPSGRLPGNHAPGGQIGGERPSGQPAPSQAGGTPAGSPGGSPGVPGGTNGGSSGSGAAPVGNFPGNGQGQGIGQEGVRPGGFGGIGNHGIGGIGTGGIGRIGGQVPVLPGIGELPRTTQASSEPATTATATPRALSDAPRTPVPVIPVAAPSPFARETLQAPTTPRADQPAPAVPGTPQPIPFRHAAGTLFDLTSPPSSRVTSWPRCAVPMASGSRSLRVPSPSPTPGRSA